MSPTESSEVGAAAPITDLRADVERLTRDLSTARIDALRALQTTASTCLERGAGLPSNSDVICAPCLRTAVEARATAAEARATAAEAERERLRAALAEIRRMTGEATRAPATTDRWLDRMEEAARAALGETGEA